MDSSASGSGCNLFGRCQVCAGALVIFPILFLAAMAAEKIFFWR